MGAYIYYCVSILLIEVEFQDGEVVPFLSQHYVECGFTFSMEIVNHTLHIPLFSRFSNVYSMGIRLSRPNPVTGTKVLLFFFACVMPSNDERERGFLYI